MDDSRNSKKIVRRKKKFARARIATERARAFDEKNIANNSRIALQSFETKIISRDSTHFPDVDEKRIRFFSVRKVYFKK
jgi:hypothetical protein